MRQSRNADGFICQRLGILPLFENDNLLALGEDGDGISRRCFAALEIGRQILQSGREATPRFKPLHADRPAKSPLAVFDAEDGNV